MREGKRRNAARRPEHSDSQQNSLPKELSEVIKQAFEASEEFVPDIESPSGAPETDRPLTTEPNSPEEVLASPAKQPDPLSGRSKDQAEPETSEPALTETPLKAEIQAPTAPSFRGQQSEIRDPEPLPARMLNEFVYCPRLFYYEYVEGVFVDNADTVRGATVHARVDKGTGALPAAQSAGTDAKADESGDGEAEGLRPRREDEKIHSRSVTLGSERLGVIAKLDLVEVRAAGEEDCPQLLSRLDVCPVDYKAGAPREGEDGNELWPTDRMQLGLQIMILRDNGYRCDRGIIYYRATKQRVPLEWTPALEAWVSAQVDSARQTMSGPFRRPSLVRQSASDVRSIRYASQTRRECSLGRKFEMERVARCGDNVPAHAES